MTDSMFVYRFTVDHVHDGDTIMGELDQGLGVYQRLISVRFAGVDAAEIDTDIGKQGRDDLEALLAADLGVGLTVASVSWDKYARRIDCAGVVRADGLDVIKAGLEAGWLRPWSGRGPKPW